MTSYEEQLQNFGKEIDDLEEKKKAEEKKKRTRSTSSNQPSNSLVPPSTGNRPQKQQVRVVGFGVEAETTALNVPQSKPVSIPSASPARPNKSSPVSPPATGSPHSPVHAAPRSIEELKSYESQIEGWSDRSTDSAPSPEIGSPSPPNNSAELFSFEEKADKAEAARQVPPKAETPAKPAPTSTTPPSTNPTATTTPAPAPAQGKPTAAPPAGGQPGKGGPGFVKPPKPKLSRSERRAIQEEQRAAKAARTGKPVGKPPAKEGAPAAAETGKGRKPAPALGAATPTAGPATPAVPAGAAPAIHSSQAPPQKKQQTTTAISSKYSGEDEKQHPLFSHLPQYRKITSQGLSVGFGPTEKIHPVIIELGLKYANGVITGSNARCVAMLTAFKDVIRDFQTPPGTALHRTLEPHLKPQIQYLTDCRPHSISMGNAINYIKKEIPKTQNCATEEEAKDRLIQLIDKFIKERIIWADNAIADYGVTKINDGDVILTYARSHSVQAILEAAQEQGIKFRVIIVDARPKREGKELLRRLTKIGVPCTYVLINAVSYVMKEATKVFVGAFTLLANGNVMSRAGTAVVAMMAHSYGVPVIVCCETYKFCERIQIDSICFNELADPDELVRNPEIKTASGEGLQDWQQRKNLKLLNLAHDVTPASFVTLVVTEVGMIPPTSVPVVLREYNLN